MAIPNPAKILHLYRYIFFFHFIIVTDEVERFPDLASPLASVGFLWWTPPGSHLLLSSSTFLEYRYSISEKASATHVLSYLGSWEICSSNILMEGQMESLHSLIYVIPVDTSLKFIPIHICFFFFFLRFFWCRPFLKSSLNLLQCCFMFWFFGPKACGILAPRPGIEPIPPALEGEVLTTGPPGNSLICFQSGPALWLASPSSTSGYSLLVHHYDLQGHCPLLEGMLAHWPQQKVTFPSTITSWIHPIPSTTQSCWTWLRVGR